MRKMKDSGIEWIGLIPETWEIIRAKNIFANHKNIVGDKESEYERLSLTLNGVIKRPKEDSKGLQSESFSTYQILYEKELVFKMIDLENVSTSRVGYSPYTGIVSPVYIVFNNVKYTRYGYYYFYNMWQRAIFNQLGNNGVRSALNASDMLNLPFPNISVEEAKKIADFLDEKIEKIDQIISKTKESIEEYKKYKQVVIAETVTNGLNYDVPKKEIELDFADKIPQHWNKIKISRLYSMHSGKNIISENFIDDGEYEVFGGNGFRGYYNEFNTEGEHLLIGRQGALCGNIHLVNGKVWATDHALVCEENTGLSFNKYYYYCFIAMNFNQYSRSAAQPGISSGQIGLLYTCLPPINEQKEIAKYLDVKCGEIDTLIEKKENFVEEMENYKKSLIYEYVTGKKEVK